MEAYDFFLDKKTTLPARILAGILTRKLSGAVAASAGRKASVLEIGPGKGDLARAIMAAGMEYNCLDRNSRLLERMKSLGAETTLAEAPPLPLPDAAFDVVVLINVLEHMPDPEKAFLLMAEIRRVLKPGGALILAAPDFAGWGSDFFAADYTHTFPVSAERLRTLFLDAGLACKSLRILYGGAGGPAAMLLNLFFSLGFGLARLFAPASSRLLKGRILFHPLLFAKAVKEG